MRRALMALMAIMPAHLALVAALMAHPAMNRATLVAPFAAYLATVMAIAMHGAAVTVVNDDGGGCRGSGRHGGGEAAQTDCYGQRNGCKLGGHDRFLNCLWASHSTQNPHPALQVPFAIEGLRHHFALVNGRM